MPNETQHMIMELAGWVIAALLAGNMFFVREFMKRIEASISSLAKSIEVHSNHLTAVDKAFTVAITKLDQQISDIEKRPFRQR